MRIPFSAGLLFLSIFINGSDAALVRLSLAGRLTLTNAADFFNPAPASVGDPWSAEITYEHPTLPIQFEPDVDSYFYYPTFADVRVQVNGLIWQGTSNFSAEAHSGPTYVFNGVPYEYGSMGAMLGSPPGLGEPISAFGISFSGSVELIGDLESLPSTLLDWKLDTAQAFGFSISFPNQLSFRSGRFDTISIQVVPEPSPLLLGAAGALAFACRRRGLSLQSGAEEAAAAGDGAGP